MQKVAVMGAGSWGTTLAKVFADAGSEVHLWARRPELAEAINRDFGSFEKFKAHFSAAATSLQGSGWAVLGYDHIAGRLIIEQLTDQQGNTSINFTPLLMLDMWEHAFYLQYKNVKADYVKAVWNVFNWDDVAERFAAATK